MRKLFWCCTAALLAAGSLTAATYQVCRYPGSRLSMGVRLVAEATLPGQALRSLEQSLVSEQSGTAAVEEHGKDLIPEDPRPVPVARPTTVPATTTSRVVVQLEEPAVETPPVIIVPEEEPESRHPVVSDTPSDPLVVEKPAHERPAIMPLVSDEAEARTTMPMVGDEADRREEKPSVFQSWLRFFKEPAPSDTAAEASEAVEPESTSGCQEDRYYHRHYPGCPYTGRSYPYTGQRLPKAASTSPRGGEEASEEESTPRPAKKVEHHHANKPSEKDEPVRIPGVDTMEYRPSDGSLDETGTGGPF